MRLQLRVIVLVACGACTPPPRPQIARSAAGPAATCRAIAEDIARVAARYPQLARFEASRALVRPCTIEYGFHTHRSTARGGWTAGVPAPDPDGIWFYIDVWSPSDPAEAEAQIHTQPVIPAWDLDGRRVTFLILEGEHTTPAAGELHAILKRHGMTGP